MDVDNQSMAVENLSNFETDQVSGRSCRQQDLSCRKLSFSRGFHDFGMTAGVGFCIDSSLSLQQIFRGFEFQIGGRDCWI